MCINYKACQRLYSIIQKMANPADKEYVQSFRYKGMSIADISKITNVPKSTVSFWCRDISLTKRQVDFLRKKSKHAGTAKFIMIGEEKRRRRLKQEREAKILGKNDVKKISKKEFLLLGLGLYWGEGYKYGNRELGFTNSDPKMIRVFLGWLYSIYGVTKSDIILRVSINRLHKERIDTVVSYWSKITNIPQTQFTKPTFIKTRVKKRYANHDQYFGILRVKVSRGANLKQRILGSLEKLGEFD